MQLGEGGVGRAADMSDHKITEWNVCQSGYVYYRDTWYPDKFT